MWRLLGEHWNGYRLGWITFVGEIEAVIRVNLTGISCEKPLGKDSSWGISLTKPF